jgi:D-alanyl-D-alanine carboxypeptidase
LLRRCAHIAFLCTGLVLVALAGTNPAGARSPSKAAAFVLDANTGAVLYNDDADERRHPASLTKMMTLYLAFETIEQGRMSMSSKVVMSEAAASAAPSKLGLEPGEDLTVREAILALITKSANDVASALAEKIGGNEANFVRLMNAKARELGMTKTNFENPSGLPDPAQVTSARDMVTLGLRLQDDFPQYYPMFATRSFKFSGKSHRNHNTLMNNFSGIDGIKTGYTRASGFNLVTSVKRSGRHVVAAVFGGSSAASRNAEMRRLLTRALTRASPVKTRKPQPALIAKLKSEPKRAERPAKAKPVAVAQAKPVELAPAPAPVKRPAPPAQRVAQAAPSPAVDAARAPEPVAAPAPVAIAKVRKIVVAPRVAKPVTPDETTDMEASAADAGAGSPPLPEVRETIVAKTSKGLSMAAADAAEGRAAMLGAGDLAEAASMPEPAAEPEPEPAPALASVEQPREQPAPAVQQVSQPAAVQVKKPASPPAKVVTASLKAAAKPVAPPEPRPVMRGAPPSSLEAQHAALASGKPARVAALAPPGGGGRFEIQIGAYTSVADAQRALDAVFARAGGVVANHASVTQPASKDGRQIYRARFRGFDASSAANACGALRKQSFDCFVMTAE